MSDYEFDSSELGTKEHWDGVYAKELTNFFEIGDEGEVWFGEDSVEKMVDWVSDNIPVDHEPTILEVGSGNGVLLFALHEIGYHARSMCGVDYSHDAVKLARAIAASRIGDAKHITFDVCDFLRNYPRPLDGTPLPLDAGHATWDVVLDKGTFDAIALTERKPNGHLPSTDYPPRIGAVVKPGGYFLIVSCNFTEAELKALFATPETGLEYHSRIKFPTYSFGGHSGNKYSSVAFHKPVQ